MENNNHDVNILDLFKNLWKRKILVSLFTFVIFILLSSFIISTASFKKSNIIYILPLKISDEINENIDLDAAITQSFIQRVLVDANMDYLDANSILKKLRINYGQKGTNLILDKINEINPEKFLKKILINANELGAVIEELNLSNQQYIEVSLEVFDTDDISSVQSKSIIDSAVEHLMIYIKENYIDVTLKEITYLKEDTFIAAQELQSVIVNNRNIINDLIIKYRNFSPDISALNLQFNNQHNHLKLMSIINQFPDHKSLLVRESTILKNLNIQKVSVIDGLIDDLEKQFLNFNKGMVNDSEISLNVDVINRFLNLGKEIDYSELKIGLIKEKQDIQYEITRIENMINSMEYNIEGLEILRFENSTFEEGSKLLAKSINENIKMINKYILDINKNIKNDSIEKFSNYRVEKVNILPDRIIIGLASIFVLSLFLSIILVLIINNRKTS